MNFVAEFNRQLNEDTLVTKGQIEVCFRLAKIHRTFKEYDSEKVYLFKTLACASKETEEDNFGDLTYIQDAKSRLLQIAEKCTSKAEGYRLSQRFSSCVATT